MQFAMPQWTLDGGILLTLLAHDIHQLGNLISIFYKKTCKVEILLEITAEQKASDPAGNHILQSFKHSGQVSDKMTNAMNASAAFMVP